MRVLLDRECAAVAGGHQSDCEYAITGVAISAGIVTGAIVGSAAGGLGAIPGGIAGGSAGALVGQIVARPYCSWAEKQEEEEDEDYVDPEVQDWHDNQYSAWHQSNASRNQHEPTVYAPHDYVADGASY